SEVAAGGRRAGSAPAWPPPGGERGGASPPPPPRRRRPARYIHLPPPPPTAGRSSSSPRADLPEQEKPPGRPDVGFVQCPLGLNWIFSAGKQSASFSGGQPAGTPVESNPICVV